MSIRDVTSLTNETVKAVRALHMRKQRDETGLFLAEGLKFITEAIELGHAPRTLLVGKDARPHPLLDQARQATLNGNGEILIVTREILEKISRRDNAQTVLATFPQRYTPLDSIDPSRASCWIALEQVRDPGNLGTIVRTADAAGCGGVILVGECCDPYSTEAVRATMGSIFAVDIARASLDDFLAWRATWPGSVVGARLQASEDYRKAAYKAPVMVFMGNEQAGLSTEAAAVCDVNVKIPMRGRADSLNLSVATGIMVYAALEGVGG
jgi:TrmH family RNA methyltransferase